MTDDERDELDSYNRVKDFNDRYPLELAAILGYPAVLTIFNAAFGKINVAAGVQAVDSSGETPAALDMKEKMAIITLKYAKKGRVMSRLAGAVALTAKLDHSKSYIMKSTKEESILRASNIKQALNDNLAICTNVLPVNITAIGTAILGYSGMKNSAVEALQTKHSHGTAVLPAQYKIARESVASFYDLVDAEWSDGPLSARVEELRVAKEIISTGHHDIKVFFTVVADEDTANVLHDANVMDESNLKEYAADDDTYVVHIYHHRAGHYHFSVSAPGRITVDFGTDVHRGLNSFTVKLKLPPPII